MFIDPLLFNRERLSQPMSDDYDRKQPAVSVHPSACETIDMARFSISRSLAALSGVVLLTLLLRAAEPAKQFSADEVAFFEKQVAPILEARCVKCHGGEKVRGELRLTTRAHVLKGGNIGPAFSPAKPDASTLLRAINRIDGLEMPPKEKLSAREIETLTKWVKMGLPWAPGRVLAANDPAKGGVVTEEAKKYWCYQPVKPPDVPNVKNHDWVRNPIDAFLLAKLEAKGLTPAGPAERVALVRRACYDLTGLPPTPEQVDAFVNDLSPDAWEKLIDRLLDSPQYGEKWGRHWLDVVRFAETNGYERDGPKPFAWRFRDYVIKSFNDDKPFDQFIREQLAGDEMPGYNPDAIIATGFYRLGLWDDEPADPLQARFDELDDYVTTTGQGFLGMSLNCARCHDHKRDPIPHADYYRLLSFFADVRRFDLNPDTRSAVALTDISPPRPSAGKELALSVNHCLVNPPDTFVMGRGNPHNPGAKVVPGFPTVLGFPDPTLARPAKGAKSSNRRTVLANWIASKDNPLTARVFVNRLWQHHFGRGIVPTPNDFGKLGEMPTHPELLDWLTDEFVRGGWHVKRMHRLIMTSAAYRMSATADDKARDIDPGNMLFGRFNMRRLTAEEVRDSILAASGRLNLKAGGPSVYPKIPREVLHGQSMPGNGWGNSPPDEAARRSVYVHVKRSLLVPILSVHDQADTDSSCPVRYTTTVPTQALGMLNGEFTNEQAVAFAERLQREAPNEPAAQVRRAIRLTTGRRTSDAEVIKDLVFLRDMQTKHHLTGAAALAQYCLLALNTNEFIYLD
jgi:hypothetical protein